MEKNRRINKGKGGMTTLADELQKQRKAVAKGARARDVVRVALEVMVERVADCRVAIMEVLAGAAKGRRELLLDLIGEEVERVAEGCLSVPHYDPEAKTSQEVFLFVGTHWKRVPGERFFLMVKECCRCMGVPKEKVNNPQFMNEVYCSVAARVARCWEPPVRPEGEAWLNLKNGTLEVDALGMPRLRAHRKEDYMVNCLPFDYDAEADCPLWQEFLDRVLPDEGCQRVLREYVANALVGGAVRLDVLLLLKGGGSNGKSVLLDVLGALAGRENVSNISLSDLTNDMQVRHGFEHKLLNTSSESESRWNAAVLKQLTSHEPVTVKWLYRNTYEMEDYGYLIAAVNEMPRAEATNAFFRRMKILPFDVTISHEEADPDLAEKLKGQLAGILNWFLRGLPGLLGRKKLSSSAVCDDELQNYRGMTDLVYWFVEECCQRADNWETGKNLFNRFGQFCQENALSSRLSSRRFYERLKGLNVQHSMRNHQNCFGLILL